MLSGRTSTVKPQTHRHNDQEESDIPYRSLLLSSCRFALHMCRMISYARSTHTQYEKRVSIAVRVILHLSLSIRSRGVCSVDGGRHQNLISFIKKSERTATHLVRHQNLLGVAASSGVAAS